MQKLNPNFRYLKQITTGAIFGYEPEFAKRADMVDYRPGDDAIPLDETVTIDLRRSAPATDPTVSKAAEGALEAVSSTPDFGRHSGVMGAILGEA